ncbi:arginine--tRNA ligase [Gemmatimonadota bacterium]
MLSEIGDQVIRAICSQIKELQPGDLTFELPPDRVLGDIAIPCFKAAKILRLSPAQIAQRFSDSIEMPEIIDRMIPTGPYLNLFLNRPKFSKLLFRKVHANPEYGSQKTGIGQKALVEHTSINPNATPHVGRARNALIGDSIARLLRFEGYDVEVHYYVNDMGKQIAYLVLESEEKDNIQFEELLEIYIAANKKAETDPNYEIRAIDLLRQFEDGNPQVEREFKRIVDVCLKGQVQVLNRMGIYYDVFDYESRFSQDDRLKNVEERLDKKNALFTDINGRVVVDLKKLGAEFEEGRYFVFQRANGSSLYGYRDIAYTLHKIECIPSNNIVVLGEDHKLYFEQLSRILQTVAVKPPEVIHYSFIHLSEGKMSTRKGNVVLLSDFLDEAISLAGERVNESCHSLTEEDRDKTASMIGICAVKFSILRVAPQNPVTFEWGTALSFEGDTGPHIQYSCARIKSILEKSEFEGLSNDYQVVSLHDAEWDLMIWLSKFPDTVQAAISARNPAIVANDVLEIAKRFNTFYHHCPVLTAETEDQYAQRISICRASLQVITTALDLLGIQVPEKM